MLESELVGVGARVADLPRSVREAISSSDQWSRDRFKRASVTYLMAAAAGKWKRK